MRTVASLYPYSQAWGCRSCAVACLCFCSCNNLDMVFSKRISTKKSLQPSNQRLIAKFQLCSLLVRSKPLHSIVLPVKEFWQSGPWWFPKNWSLRKFYHRVVPWNFISGGVSQSIKIICNEIIRFRYSKSKNKTQSDFLVVVIGRLLYKHIYVNSLFSSWQ